MERRLVCGDPEGPEGWKKIPLNQAQFHLSNFLQDRGYFQPRFVEDGGVLIATLGPQTRVSRWDAPGAPAELKLRRKRKVVGSVLTPKLLDELEGWVKLELQTFGYACPAVKSQADPETGHVTIHVRSGPKMKWIGVREEGIPGVDPWTLRRYDAFRLGDEYDGRWVTVTENRMTALDIVQSVTLSTECTEDGAFLVQRVVPGPPRLLAFRVGVNTEELLLTRLSWRNTRMGTRASWLDVSARASSRIQSLSSTVQWFHLPYSSRRSIRPTIELRRQNERDSETLSASTQLAYGTSWELADVGGDLRSGPTLELFRRVRGVGQPNSRFVGWETRAEIRSHAFEYYAASPRTGFLSTLSLGLASEDLLSSVSAQRLNWTGQFLWNVADYDPPLFVVGVRSRVNATLSPERPGPQTRLPVPYLYFLGGSQDLRGFSRRELPDLDGALTTAYIGVETRLVATLPADLEPIAFVDMAKYSKTPMRLDSPLFWSPGIGLRWQSPFGTLRTTLAHGYEAATARHWQFFLSFGEEF